MPQHLPRPYSAPRQTLVAKGSFWMKFHWQRSRWGWIEWESGKTIHYWTGGKQSFRRSHVENESSRIKMCERISSSLISNVSSLKHADTNLIISVCQAYMTIHFNKVEYPVPSKLAAFFSNENTWETRLEQERANKAMHFWSFQVLASGNTVIQNVFFFLKICPLWAARYLTE